MIRFPRCLSVAGLAVALLGWAVPAVSHGQQTSAATTKAKPAKKKHVKKDGAGSSTGAPTVDPINPTASPEPPTPTTQGPPIPPTTPSTNAPQPSHP